MCEESGGDGEASATEVSEEGGLNKGGGDSPIRGVAFTEASTRGEPVANGNPPRSIRGVTF
jgi:hypothetical protein